MAQSWRSQPSMDNKCVSVHITKRWADTIFGRISSPFSGEGTERLLKCEHHTAEDARSHEPQNWDETQDSALICFIEFFCVFYPFFAGRVTVLCTGTTLWSAAVTEMLRRRWTEEFWRENTVMKIVILMLMIILVILPQECFFLSPVSFNDMNEWI